MVHNICIRCKFALSENYASDSVNIDNDRGQVQIKGKLYDLAPEERDFILTVGPDSKLCLCLDCVRSARLRSGKCGLCTVCLKQPLIDIEPCLLRESIAAITSKTMTIDTLDPAHIRLEILHQKPEPLLHPPKDKPPKSTIGEWFSWLKDTWNGDTCPERTKKNN